MRKFALQDIVDSNRDSPPAVPLLTLSVLYEGHIHHLRKFPRFFFIIKTVLNPSFYNLQHTGSLLGLWYEECEGPQLVVRDDGSPPSCIGNRAWLGEG